MPTLADALRGYQPPTTSALADPIVEHFRTLPQQLATNQQAMDNTMASMYKTDMATGQPNPNYRPEAMNEFTQIMPNVGGMMIGPSSALWNKVNAFNAAKMLKQGNTPEDVWKSTGTVKGLENAFRQEISDESALLKGAGNFGDIYEHRKAMHGVTTPTIEEVMRHPQLYESYPELKSIQVRLLPETSKNNASYSPVEKIISVNPKLTSDQATSSILHELQHGVQEIEGWNKGADANTILKNYQQQLDDIDTRLTEANLAMKKAVGTDAYNGFMAARDKISKEYRALTGTDIHGIYGKAMDEYKAHGGEAEARLTQARQKLTADQRKEIFPFVKGKNALDINPEDAIIKMKHDSPTITRKELLQQLLNEQK